TLGLGLGAGRLGGGGRGHGARGGRGRGMDAPPAGTLPAALPASVASLSLVVTDFRGFRHFGVIGGVGILLCWITAYTILPAGLAIVERRNLVRARHEPALGRLLVRLAPPHPPPLPPP